MSNTLHFAQHTLQEVCLAIMALVYSARLIWMFRFKLGKERQATTSRRNTDRSKGAMYSMFNVAMPWGMESTRRRPLFYISFAVFHVGLVAAIVMSFIIPYAPHWMTPTVVLGFQVVMGAACAIGVWRIIRRASNPYMRAISSPDDYFSVLMVTVWSFFAVLAAPNNIAVQGEWASMTYFVMTAFFLLYVPFSKISHYIYYPFGRIYLGRTLGHRGVFPLQRGSKPANAPNLEPRALEMAEATKEG